MLDVLRHRLTGFPSEEWQPSPFLCCAGPVLAATRPALHPKPQAPGRLPGCVTHPSSHCQVTHISCRRLLAGAMPRPESAPKPSSALPRVWLGSLGANVVITICAPAADQAFVHDVPLTDTQETSSAAVQRSATRTTAWQQKKTSSRVTAPPKRDSESRTHGPAASISDACKRAVMGQLNPPLPERLPAIGYEPPMSWRH